MTAMGALLSRMTRRGTLAQIDHVVPPHPAAATGLVSRVYAQVERDFGILAPPISLHAPAPEVLAGAWMMLRESLLCGAGDRAAKEAVAAGVSLGNTCPFCVQVHSTFLHGLVRGRDAAAIAAGRPESVADADMRRFALWARDSGRPSAGRRAPFPDAVAAEFRGVAVVFQYLNRMVNVFIGDPPIPDGLRVREPLMRVIGGVLRLATRPRVDAGAGLDLLPAAPPGEDLGWAGGTVAEAFARAGAAIEAAGRRSVPEPVRDLVTARLAGWDGSPPGLRRSWAEEAVAGLAARDRPAGRLALLTAMASYQVGPAEVEEFRRERPGDRPLVELTSWASLRAARHVSGWLRG